MPEEVRPAVGFDDDDDIPIVSGGSQGVLRGSVVIGLNAPSAPPAGVKPPVAPPPAPEPAVDPAPAAPAVPPQVPVAPAPVKREAFSFLKSIAKKIAESPAAGNVASGGASDTLSPPGADNGSPAAKPVPAAPSEADKLADETLASSGVSLDSEMSRRFRGLAALYLRDLRDELETSSKMSMPTVSGGLGLSAADAGKLMGKLKEGVRSLREKLVAETSASKASYVGAMSERRLQETEKEEAKDQASRDDLYTRILEKTKKHSSVAKPPAPKPSVTRVIPVIPHSVSDSGTTSLSPAAPPVIDSALGRAIPLAALPSPDVEAIASPRPAPSGPSEGESAPAPEEASSRPSMTDVVGPPRLVGPVEELRRMTVADFRRLSRDPKEACLKVKDKVDLLAERGFGSKSQAAVAWQDSEVNKLYLQLLRQSLEGMPVVEVIEKRDREGETTLTKAEFDAIMALNRKLRFG